MGLSLIAAIGFAAYMETQSCHIPGWTDEHDQHIRNMIRLYWPHDQAADDGCIKVKSQIITESSFNPNAVSAVGARCLMQIMPSTQRDIERRMGWSGNIFEPDYCIRLGVFYMSRNFKYFSWDRTTECRWGVSVAGYNCGNGNVDKGQVYAGGARCWDEIQPYMHYATGHHSVEVTNYVSRVRYHRRQGRDWAKDARKRGRWYSPRRYFAKASNL